MKYFVLCFTLNLLFFINTVFSQEPPIEFEAKKTITLSCEGEGDVKWMKDDKPVEVKGRVGIRKDKKKHVLEISNAEEGDAGTYICRINDNDKAVRRVVNSPHVKVPTNINVVEDEKLRIHCQVVGNPVPELSWQFNNGTEYNITDTSNPLERIIIENDPDRKTLNNSVLIIEHVAMYDRGIFTCFGTTDFETVSSSCHVRIKDKYAALWPFLGIVAEVIILCAIIFIYEKKHNKAEMEESDTDNSPDQKNTPDHKDSNLRQRQ